MELVIISIIVLLGAVSYGLFVRKKIYDEVDRCVAWKIDIMNRPVTDEISRVKNLNMTGQTEEKFEVWRAGWDEIITVKLPEIEEKSFDAEEAADRYRFKKAKQILMEMSTKLQAIEDEISHILSQLKELVGSEENNRVEIEKLKQELKSIRRKLLSERHQFGKSEARLEIELEDIEEKMAEFFTATEGGNYFEAREIIFKMKDEVSLLAEKVEMIPSLLTQCSVDIPADIQELLSGYQEMVTEGYNLGEYRIEEELYKLHQQTASHLKAVEKAEISEAAAGISEILERIEQIYDILEQEVKSHQIVNKEGPKIKPELEQLKADFIQTKEEVEYVQYSYELNDGDIQQISEMEKSINQAMKRADHLQLKLESKASTAFALHKELEKINEQIEVLKIVHVQFREMLKSLRKDEVTAKEKIAKIKKLLIESNRIVQKSNLPGLPESFFIEFESANESIAYVMRKLDEKPLQINAVQQLLKEAEENVEHVFEEAREMIEKAELTEKVIQYGNRYRSQYPMIAAKLAEAEYSFRMFDYDSALEQAAIAVEEIEPGAMKRLEKLLSFAHQ